MDQQVESRVVHTGRDNFVELGVHSPPLDRSSTFPTPDLVSAGADIDALAAGAHHPPNSSVYSRIHHPTVARWEDGIAELEHADGAVAFGSGMAAITAVMLAAGAPGGHFVGVRPLYGGTDMLLSSGLLGSSVTWCDPHEVADAITDDTRLVIIESPCNPTLTLVDIADVVAQAGDVPVAVDNTFATPLLQRPLDLGAAYSIHSATKYLGGHGDVIAGVVAADEQRCAEVRQVRIMTGGLLAPDVAWLLHRSLPTLAMRVERAQDNAEGLVARLGGHDLVTRVYYPGLPGADPEGLIGTQMDGPGAMVSFLVDGGFDVAADVMASVEMIMPAVSLGSVDSLLQHPAALTHRLVDEGARTEHGMTGGLLRLSVGVEHVDDIWEDLCQALDGAAARAGTDASAGSSDDRAA